MQVQRLIAVLSVPSIGRSALLQDAALHLPKELPNQDMAVLSPCRPGGLKRTACAPSSTFQVQPSTGLITKEPACSQ